MQTPPEFAEYPRAKGQPSGVLAKPPGVYFEAINDGWALFARAWPTWVAAQLVVGFLAIAIYVPFGFLETYLEFGKLSLFPPGGSEPSPAWQLLSWTVDLLPGLVAAGLQAGMLSMAIRQVRGDRFGFGDAFCAFRHAPKLLLIGAVVSLPAAVFNAAFGTLVGFGATVGLSLLVSPLLALAPFIAVGQDLSGREAIALGVRALGGFVGWFRMLLLFIVMGLIYICGFVACCVGVLAAGPICVLIMAVHYYYFFPEVFQPAQPPFGQPLSAETAPPVQG